MNWSPRIPVEVSATLSGIAVLLALWWILRSRSVGRKAWRFPIFLCRATILALLLVILLNPVERDVAKGSDATSVILLDASASMGVELPDNRYAQALEWIAPVLKESGDGFPPRVILFDETIRSSLGPEHEEPDGVRTNLASALRKVVDGAGSAPPAGILVVSDGLAQDRSDLPVTLERAAARKIPVFTHTIGASFPPRNAWLQDLHVQRSARPDTKVPVEITVRTTAFKPGTPLELTLINEADKVVARTNLKAGPDPGEARLSLTSGLRTQEYRLQLSETPGELTTADNSLTFTLEVRSPKIRVLNMEGTHRRRILHTDKGTTHWNEIEFVNRALEATGEIEVDTMTPVTQYADARNLRFVTGFADGHFLFNSSRQFPATRKDLFKYDVIICSDVPQGNYTREEMEWVVELVTQRGGGFCMVGGHTAFDSGNWDKTPWERITPVDMMHYGHGYTYSHTATVIPPSVQDHPIWQILSDPEANRLLLKTHPPFHGFHDIKRAKPGATLLALRDDGGGPLMAVQAYGRGRSMAFLPDSNGAWGNSFLAWGPPDSGITVGPGEELGHGPAILKAAPKGFKASDSIQLDHHPAEYYGRFWVNVVKWLAENSVRQQREDLIGRVRNTTVRPGQTVELSAEVFAAIPASELPNLSVQARLAMPGAERHPLEWNRERREFVGELLVPDELPSERVTLVFDTSVSDTRINDEIQLGVLNISPELEETRPDHQLMADLADVSNGRVVNTAAEAISFLRESVRKAQETEEAYTRPQWDRPWVWALLVGLLGLEWLMRRVGDRPAAA